MRRNQTRINAINNQAGISTQELQRFAPAVFASTPKASVSDRYQFVSTAAMIAPLLADGYIVTGAQQKVARAANFAATEYNMHLLRLRRADTPVVLDGVHPELIVMNGHDGMTSFQMRAGMFRLVCANGMVIADRNFGAVKLRHTLHSPIQQEAAALIERARTGARVADGWMRKLATWRQQEVFAERAIAVAYGDNAPIAPRQVLQAHRTEDGGHSVWSVFNRVQENIIQGGLGYRAASGRRTATRGISEVKRNVEVNAKLWSLAQDLADEITA